MNKSQVIGLSFLALIGLYFYKQSRSAGQLTYYIKSVDLKWQGMTPVFVLNIAIQNPSNTSFTITSLAGNLYANDEYVGNVSSFVTATVGPSKEIVYPLNIVLSLLGATSDLVKIFSGGGVTQMILFEGTVNANGIAADITLKKSIG